MKKINFFLTLVLFTACRNSDSTFNNDIEKKNIQIETVEQVEDTLTYASEEKSILIHPSTFNGTLVIPPAKFASVSMIMGGIIKQVNLLPGIYVSKGALLATLENPDFIEIQYNYLDSHAQLEYLETEYKRQQKLAEEEVASQKKYQQSKAEYFSMKSRKQAAEAQLKLLGVDPSDLLTAGISPYIEVRAPINGFVSNVQVNTGKYIEPGEALCNLIDKSETMVRLTAYEKDMKSLITGKRIKFRVNGLDDQDFYATLVTVGQHIDDFSRSFELYAKVDENNPLFRPGMYVSAQLEE